MRTRPLSASPASPIWRVPWLRPSRARASVAATCRELGEGGLAFELSFFVEHARVPDIGVALDGINRGLLTALAGQGIALGAPMRRVQLRDARIDQR